jgi:hypothetical protein
LPYLLDDAVVVVAAFGAAADGAVDAFIVDVAVVAVVVIALLICLEVGMHLLGCCKRERTRAGSTRRQASSAAAARVVRVRVRAGHGLRAVSCVELCSKAPW